MIGQLVLEMPPDPFDQVEVGAIRRKPHRADAVVVSHPPASCRMPLVIADVVEHDAATPTPQPAQVRVAMDFAFIKIDQVEGAELAVLGASPFPSQASACWADAAASASCRCLRS